jgi:diadenylate cyclase
MEENPMIEFKKFWATTISNYIENPWNIITLIIDLLIVFLLVTKIIKVLKGSRAMQLIKGIIFLIAITALSSIFNLKILNYLLTTLMTYGVILLIVLFQPELRRALEQLGASNKLTRYFGLEKDIISKTKEDIYKIGIAVMELSKTKTGALIVIERDIKLKEIISTGVSINGEISPQLLVNIFTPNTPLHDGAVIISDNKISAAACMLPLASDGDIARELGTRHRAAIGMSKESDAVIVVVSEETGKISIAKEGTLIADLKEEALKKILISNIITKRFKTEDNKTILDRVKNLKSKKSKE